MTTLLVSARAIHYISGMVLAGVVMFRWLILRPGLASAAESNFLCLAPFFRRMKLLFVCSAAGVLVSEIALFWITGSDMAGEPLTGPDALTVLFQTQFGHVCLFRAGLIVLLGALMVPLIRSNWTGRPSPIEIGAGIPAVLLLVSNSLAGHAAALGVFSWRVVPDVVHLLAVSVWPAGLLFFASRFAESVREAGDGPRPGCGAGRSGRGGRGVAESEDDFSRGQSESIIVRNDSPDVGFGAGINPYRGCEHGCAYCYARPYHEYLGFSAGLEFETKIMVKRRAAELLRRELSGRNMCRRCWG
jgi:hypothetical protein